MKKEVLIAIKGLQSYEDQDDDCVELVTHGNFYKKGEDYYITYDESEITGLGKTSTTVKVEPNRVTIIRFGETRSHMIFEEGEKHVSYYDMGAGSLTIGISTKKLRARLNDNGGRLVINYTMEINNSMTGENSFDITVSEL